MAHETPLPFHGKCHFKFSFWLIEPLPLGSAGSWLRKSLGYRLRGWRYEKGPRPLPTSGDPCWYPHCNRCSSVFLSVSSLFWTASHFGFAWKKCWSECSGSKRRAKQMVVDLGEAITRNMHCIIFKPEGFALSVNVNAYLNLLNTRIELS